MTDAPPLTIKATFLTAPHTKIALDVTHKALASTLGGFTDASLVQAISGTGDQLDLTLSARSNGALAHAVEHAGPHIELLSKSAHLMSLEVFGPVSEEIKAGLKPFFPVFHDSPAGD